MITSSIVERDIEIIIASLGREVHALEGKTVLISGGSGFLGSHFLAVFERLNQTVFAKPCSVIAIDNFVTGTAVNLLRKVTDAHISFKKADICAPFSIRGPVDYIIHLAGIASPVYYMKFPLETIRTATVGTEQLLELARRKKSRKLLFFSSSEIYGDPAPEFIPTPETYKGNVSSTGPRACYDESKRLGETMCMVYNRVYEVPVAIVRPFNVYGPGMKQDDRRVIPQFLTCALNGKPLPVHGNGLQTRTYCYTTDALTGFFKVLLSKKSGEVYNIGREQGEINLIDLAKLIARLLNRRVDIANIPYPKEYPSDEPLRRCPDMSKARRELRYTPEVHLKTGLKRMAAWYQKQYVRQ